jgi:hypothetical protein
VRECGCGEEREGGNGQDRVNLPRLYIQLGFTSWFHLLVSFLVSLCGFIWFRFLVSFILWYLVSLLGFGFSFGFGFGSRCGSETMIPTVEVFSVDQKLCTSISQLSFVCPAKTM